GAHPNAAGLPIPGSWPQSAGPSGESPLVAPAEAGGQRVQRRQRIAHRALACRIDAKVPLALPATFGGGLTEARFQVALGFEAIQRGIDARHGEVPAGFL